MLTPSPLEHEEQWSSICQAIQDQREMKDPLTFPQPDKDLILSHWKENTYTPSGIVDLALKYRNSGKSPPTMFRRCVYKPDDLILKSHQNHCQAPYLTSLSAGILDSSVVGHSWIRYAKNAAYLRQGSLWSAWVASGKPKRTVA